MYDLLTPAEQRVLLRAMNDSTELQSARIRLERRSLDNLLLLREEIKNCRLPGVIEKTRNGMVTLDMLKTTRGGR